MTWNNQTLSYYFEIKIKDNLSTTVTMGFNHENFKIYIVLRWESKYGTPMAIIIMVSLITTMMTSLIRSKLFKSRMWTFS
jgi:hypothetical protein